MWLKIFKQHWRVYASEYKTFIEKLNIFIGVHIDFEKIKKYENIILMHSCIM